MIIAGSLISGLVYQTVRGAEQRYAAQIMDRYADEVAEAVGDRVSRYGEALTDLASALGSHRDLDEEDFTRAGSSLSAARLPGASGVTFVVPGNTARTAAIQEHWRSRGTASLTLTPTAGYDEHRYAVLDRAFDDGGTLLGVDLVGSEPLMAVMGNARQFDGLAVSATYQLVRDRGVPPELRQNAVALAVPVRTGLGVAEPDVFSGWLVMGVRGQDFLSQTLLTRGQRAVQVRLADPGGTVIATATPGRRAAGLTRIREVEVGQRTWTLTMWPTRGLLSRTDRGMGMLTGLAGMALTGMLALVTGVLAGSRNRAFRQVEQATAALRRDIERRERAEAQLRHLALHDQLTGLANRQLFYERLSHAIDTHARGAGTVAVLFIDLDGFKQINDARGHHAGDAVLMTVGERLRAGLRTGDTVARFGGDEFAAVLESLGGVGEARLAAERIIADVREPIDVGGVPALVSASIGVAIHQPGATADDMIREADAAMYAAKAAGKNRYHLAG